MSPQTGRFGALEPLETRWIDAGRNDNPLIVCLHGGGYDDRYFDAPAHSFMERAASAGFSSAALSRPGCPATDTSAAHQPSFEAAAGIIADAIGQLWTALDTGGPGVVLVGHSIGAAIAIYIAARQRDWPLLGVAISGVGDVPDEAAVERFSQLPANLAVQLPFSAVRPTLYGPDWTLAADTLGNVEGLLVSCSSADLIEINVRWPRELPALAPEVGVPVHYVLAEYDGLWKVSAERVRTFAAYFTQAPFVDAALWRNAGHNIEHHRVGPAYVHSVLGFASRCAVENGRAQT